jgi:hypothetical protein
LEDPLKAQNVLAKYPKEALCEALLNYVAKAREALGPLFIKVMRAILRSVPYWLHSPPSLVLWCIPPAPWALLRSTHLPGMLV